MKKKLILFAVLCGLFAPRTVRSAEFAEALTSSLSDGLRSLGEAAGDLAEAVGSMAKEMTEAIGDRAEVQAAAKGLFKSIGEQMEKLGGVLKDLGSGEEKAAIMKSFADSLKSSLRDSVEALKAAVRDDSEGAAESLTTRLKGSLEGVSGKFQSAFNESLKGLAGAGKLGAQAIKALNRSMGTALDENAGLIATEGSAAALRPPSAAPAPAGMSDDAVAGLDDATSALQSRAEDVAERADALPSAKAAKAQQEDQFSLFGEGDESTFKDVNWDDDLDVTPEPSGESPAQGEEPGEEPEEEDTVEPVGPEAGGYGPAARGTVRQRMKNWWGGLKEKWAGQAREAERLTEDIDERAEELRGLEADAKKPQRMTFNEEDGTVSMSGDHFDRVGGDEESSAVLNDALEEGDGTVSVSSRDVTVTKDWEGDLTVRVRVKNDDGQEADVVYKLRNVSKAEEKLLTSPEAAFRIGRDGKLSVEGTEDIGADIKLDGETQTARIAKLKSDLTTLRAARSEIEGFLQKSGRLANQGAQSFERFGTAVKQTFRSKEDFQDTFVKGAKATGRGTARGAKFLGKNTVAGIKKFVSGTVEILKMMMTGVFFGIPSMLYQTLMQNAQAKALYEEITAVYHITPTLAVQTPASLIPEANAGQAGTYLYVAVDPSTSGYGKKFSAAELENGSYYVVYQTGAQWGSTYATSQNAFGVWVNLNTGLIFMDGGVPYSDQTPFAYLLEPSNDSTLQAAKGAQTTLSVAQYTQQAFDAVGNRANYNYSEGYLDSVAPWGIKASNDVIKPNGELQTLFAPVESTHTLGHEKIQKPSRYAPQLLVPTLNKFRTGIQDVTGFLPSSQTAVAPAISIRQIEGTGVLNTLLGSQSAQNNIEESINMILALTTMPAPSGHEAAGVKNPLEAVAQAQAALQSALEEVGNKHYGDDVFAAVARLKEARTHLQNAIGTITNGANPGFDPSVDVNAVNIYVYETEDTPIALFTKKHRASDVLPAKDYLLFLDVNYNIVPLFATGLITRADGIGVIDYDVSQINPAINYMVSLVTGLAYRYSNNGPGTSVTTLGDVPAAQYIASTIMAGLFQNISLVLASSEATNFINQILTMANYATNLSYQGPVIKNGCIFDKVPLEASYQDTATSEENLVLSDINGVTFPPAQSATTQAPFGPFSSGQKAWLRSLYVYKVSKFITGGSATGGQSSREQGVFGTNLQGGQVYDYVVPFMPAQIQNQDGSYTTYYQTMPLGISETGVSISNSSSAQLLMASLVSGQVYDSNYAVLTNPPYTANIMERTAAYQPIAAQPGQTSRTLQTANGPMQVAVVENVSLGTGFMPTFANPYNLIYSSMQGNPAYAGDFSAVSNAQAQVTALAQNINGMIDTAVYPKWAEDIWSAVQGMNVQTSATLSQQYVPYLVLPGESTSQPGQLFTSMQSWLTEKVKLVNAQQTLAAKKQAFEKDLKPPFAPVAKTTDQMLQMCPMYWMHFAQFAYAPQSASMQQIQYNNPSQQQETANINWINTTVNASPTPLSCALGQAVPQSFVQDVITAYNGWEDIMNSSNGVAQILQSGPFQFTQNMKCNVYLTLPPTNGSVTSIGTGNFFYNLVPVAPTTTLFAIGALDGTVASNITSNLSAATPVVGLSSPLTIDQCNVGSRLGTSFLEIANPVAIDLSTGDVWFPTPLGTAAVCYGSGGNIATAKCNITKIGTLDPEKVLDVALKNQGSSRQDVANNNPGLYSMLMNCQSVASQAAQLALSPFYFAGRLLSLCQEQITHGTYIYAVNVTAENYYGATDYWVATDANWNPIGRLTPQTNYMMSLVSGNIYQMNLPAQNGQGLQQTETAQGQDQQVGIGEATLETPQTAFQRLFGVGSYGTSETSTLLTPVQSNNPQLFDIIESLNQVQNQNFLQAQFSSSANGQLVAAPLPLSQLKGAAPVSALYSNIYQVNGKYYLAMPGTGGNPSYYYDFNAQMQDVTVSAQTGQPVYTAIPGNAKRGMYYLVEGGVATPMSELTGYGSEAMRMRFGIQVAADGTETIGLPVYNPPLPMASNDVTLAPGSSGTNMKCLSIPGKTTPATTVTDTYTYYYYKNIVSDTYLVRNVLNTTIPIYDATTQSFSSLAEKKDYYVDMVTGECYNSDGTPKLSQIMVAYNFSGSSSTGIVANTAMDFSNPLFVWGDLDLLGESLQTNMFYQDTNSGDPSNGYNQYQVQQGSTVFTVFTPGSSKGVAGTQTTYAYGTETDANNNLLITQNGTTMVPNQTSMSTVLVNALNGGASLVSKSYIMNIGGIIPSGTPPAGASVTVTETFTNPKQYMVSYTNSGGTLTNDMFQVPVQAGTAPGASQNAWNNPPLDATLQQQLMQAKPFCASVFGSCPYLKEVANQVSITALGTVPVTCGLLYQPATASTFTLPSAGLLSMIFSGANPNSSANATNGQYFAFYDSYNNGAGTSSNVVPSKGQYGTFVSVVSSMTNNLDTAVYPGLYAGNFNVSFPLSSAATPTYGAPYLRVVGSLPGTIDSNTLHTDFPVPTSGTEYLYKYMFDTVANALLAQLKATINVCGNINGFMQLVSALDAGTIEAATVSNPTFNPAATAVIQNQVSYATPVTPTTQEPTVGGRFVYKLSCSSGGTDAASGAPTNQLCQIFYPTQASGSPAAGPDTYIDILNGLVFQAKTTTAGQALLYPVGFSVTNNLRNGITLMIGGALPAGAASLTVQTAPAGQATVSGIAVTSPVASSSTQTGKGSSTGTSSPVPTKFPSTTITPVPANLSPTSSAPVAAPAA